MPPRPLDLFTFQFHRPMFSAVSIEKIFHKLQLRVHLNALLEDV